MKISQDTYDLACGVLGMFGVIAGLLLYVACVAVPVVVIGLLCGYEFYEVWPAATSSTLVLPVIALVVWAAYIVAQGNPKEHGHARHAVSDSPPSRTNPSGGVD